jgi:3-oxoadipate enol-lactonase
VALQRMFPDDFLAANPAIAEERKATLRAAKPENFAAACRALARFMRARSWHRSAIRLCS